MCTTPKMGGGGGTIFDALEYQQQQPARQAEQQAIADQRQSEIDANYRAATDRLNAATAATQEAQARAEKAAEDARNGINAASQKEAADAAALAERQRAAKARGRASNVLTSGQGLLGGAPTKVSAASALLG